MESNKSMSSEKPKIVLVGVGKFGKNHLRVLNELENAGICELYGVVELKHEALKLIKKKKQIKTSADFHDFLIDDVDAIDIATPTNTHYNISKESLAAGKHVFVEKPLTANYEEAKELARIAKEKDRTIMVGHIFRYNPAVWKLKELMKRGDLGEVYYMFGHFMGLKDPRLDTGVLFNYAVHHIDIFDYLLEKLPQEVTCRTHYVLGRRELEDVALLVLKYAPGILGIIECSWLPPKKQRDLTVVGSNRSISIDLLNQTLEVYDACLEKCDNTLFKAVDRGVTKINVNFKEPLKLELVDFIESIKTGRKPLANDQVALKVIKVAEKALESAKLGRTLRFNNDE